MARLPRYCPPGLPQHVIQRGNNRQVCFVSDQDMAAYAHWLEEGACRYGLAIHAWVFMDNHVHLLATPEEDDSLSKTLQHTGSQYVRYFNRRYGRTGTLFEGRFRSCLVQDEKYLLICHRYIEMNPVRAGIVSDPADYAWSSYRANGFGKVARLWTPHPNYLALGVGDEERQANYRALFQSQLERELLQAVRYSVNRGMALGSEKFKDEIEFMGGRRQRLLKTGPKPAGGEEFLL